MFNEIGGFFGWLLIAAFVGTILNYCIKFVNKKWGKKISSNPTGKKIIKLLMTIFVKYHKYFGFMTLLFLLTHFFIQFSKSGINWTGAIAAALMILQVLLGIYANLKKRPRKGAWFVTHRTIALLMIVAIAYHLLAPYSINATINNNKPSNISSQDTTKLPVFTLDELAKFNGKNGTDAYVAYKGIVYDVTHNSKWNNGSHHGQSAGTDLTDQLSLSPHGDKVFKDLPVIGSLKN